MSESPELAAAWDLAIRLSIGMAASMLQKARAGHFNAGSIVAMALADCDCESCGPLEECPCASREAWARREALRALAQLLGAWHPCPSTEPTGLVGEFHCTRDGGHQGDHEAWVWMPGKSAPELLTSWT